MVCLCTGARYLNFGLASIKSNSFNFIRNASKMAPLPRVFFDMTADDQPVGRIVVEVSNL